MARCTGTIEGLSVGLSWYEMTDCLYPGSRDFRSWFETDSKKPSGTKTFFFRNDLMIDFMTVLSLDQTIQRLFRDYPEGIVHLRKLSNTQFLIKYFISQILHWPQDSKNIKVWPKMKIFPKKSSSYQIIRQFYFR